MKNHFYFPFCLFVLLLVLSFQNNQAQNIKKRQLNLYNKGGKFDFNWSVSTEERSKMKSKLKDFMQTHLSQKRLARVTFAIYSMEGDPFISNFYVEQNKNERWVIVDEWKNTCCMLYFLEKKKRKPVTKKGTAIYKTIEELEIVLNERIPY